MLSKIFTLLIMVLLFNAVVFIFANDNYYKGYNEFPGKEYKSFLMADSHGLSIEKSPEKYGVYNFSDNSDSYFDIKRKISYLIDNHYTIDKIYITVDNYSLSPYRDGHNNMDRSIIYESKKDFNYYNEKYVKYYFPIFQSKVNTIFRNYLEDKLTQIFFPESKASSKVIWNQLSEGERVKRAEERVSGQFPSKHKSQNLEKALKEIIDVCQSHHIELIGVKFPLSKQYLEALGQKNYGADQIMISKGLRVLDYKSVFIDHTDYFRDQDHLNSKGGEEFAKILLQ